MTGKTKKELEAENAELRELLDRSIKLIEQAYPDREKTCLLRDMTVLEAYKFYQNGRVDETYFKQCGCDICKGVLKILDKPCNDCECSIPQCATNPCDKLEKWRKESMTLCGLEYAPLSQTVTKKVSVNVVTCPFKMHENIVDCDILTATRKFECNMCHHTNNNQPELQCPGPKHGTQEVLKNAD